MTTQKEIVRKTRAWTDLIRGFSIDRVPKNERMQWFKACLGFKEAIESHKIDGIKKAVAKQKKDETRPT